MPDGTNFLAELRQANLALGKANQVADEPWRSIIGALFDAVIALEALVEDAETDGGADQ